MEMESRERALDKLYRRRDRYDIPGWQREGDVWDTIRQQKLIDSILRGWHLPKFYLLKLEGADDYYEVVDGQQRLVAIWAFFDGKLRLSEESAAEFGGPKYSDLTGRTLDAFDDFEIQYEEISNASEQEVTDLFQRLQLGVGLTPDEKLNAVPGKLRDFCREAANHPFFRQKVSFPNRRYSFFGVCVRFVYLEIQGIPNQLRLRELESLLTQYAGFSSSTPVASRILAVLGFLDQAFPAKSAVLRNRSSLLALLRLAARLVENGIGTDKADRVGRFFESFNAALRKEVERGSGAEDTDLIDFQESVTANLTSATAVRARERILEKKLLLWEPILAEYLVTPKGAPSWVDEDVPRFATGIDSLIHAINSAYAGDYGHDLFKPTNAATKALATLRVPIHSLRQYGELVDALYVLAYEGTGDGKRYGDTLPMIVSDLRDLRTHLRHDVDHGPPGKAGSKRKRLAATFRKYSGVNSPEVLPDAAFSVVQVKLLTAFHDLLRTLASKYQNSGTPPAPHPQGSL